ncbi:MAG: hypothetical protein ABI454_09435 [Sphingomicrobium sp.]
MASKKSLISVAAVLVSACMASPRAQLGLITDPSQLRYDELDTYAFPRTYVDIAAGEKAGEFTAEARNVSYEGFRIALRRADGFGIRTNLNLTKVKNTDMVQQAGVEVVDNRVKTIEAIGQLATKIVGSGFIPLATGELELPVSIDTEPLILNLPRGGSQYSKTSPASWEAVRGVQATKYWIGPIQPDADRVTADRIAGFRSGLVYAGCREMLVIFDAPTPATDNQPAGTITVQKSVYISDPHYFRFVAFPSKGDVTIHPQCGTSVAREKDDGTSSNVDVASALVEQAKALREAIKKAKPASQPDGSSDQDQSSDQ